MTAVGSWHSNTDQSSANTVVHIVDQVLANHLLPEEDVLRVQLEQADQYESMIKESLGLKAKKKVVNVLYFSSEEYILEGIPSLLSQNTPPFKTAYKTVFIVRKSF